MQPAGTFSEYLGQVGLITTFAQQSLQPKLSQTRYE